MLKVSFPAGTSTYYTSTAGRPASAYYTDEATQCEPPGVWWGSGAAELGLTGYVDAEQAEAVFDHLIDPRDPASTDRASWNTAATLGRAPGRYKAAEHIEAEMLAAEPDATPERREVIRIEAGLKVRTAHTFTDATFSPVKSISLLHIAAVREADLATRRGDHAEAAAWQWVCDEVEAAVMEGNRAGMAYLADHAGYTRAGHHGGAGGTWRDAHELTVASFLQYSTRAGDPGLHVHNLVLNRAKDADGQWRALHTSCLVEAQHGAGAIAAKATETRLGRTLGLAFELREDGVCKEIAGTTMPMLDPVCTRRRQIARAARPLVEALETRLGRPLNALELRNLLDDVARRTRDRKTIEHQETPQQRAERIDARSSAMAGMAFQAVADTLLSSSKSGPVLAEPFSPDSIIKEALDQVGRTRPAWNRHHLVRQIVTLLPALGDATPAQQRQLAERLADQALAMTTYGEHQGAVLGATSTYGAVCVSGSVQAYVPGSQRLANGRSAFVQPGSERYATAGSLVAERALRRASVVEDGCRATPTAVRQWLAARAEAGLALSADQAQAVEGILTGGQQLSILIGPAGTGKSRVAAVLAEAWTDPALWTPRGKADAQPAPPGRMVGLAVSQNAANVLAEQGMVAMNVRRWLTTQQRLADGHAQQGDEVYRLRAGDMVLVDEASMVDTADADAIRHHVQAAGARWIWAGDHRQLGAVGAGGMMADLAPTATTFELAQVHRMRAEWERAASLRLRDGDLTVLADYERHGRLRACPSLAHAETDAARAWLADTLAGVPSTVVVATNEQAARLATLCRNDLVALGRVQPEGVHLPRQSTLAGVGDTVVTRSNHRHLATVDGQRAEVWNRDRWQVTEVRADGALVVTPISAIGEDAPRVVLPAGYVAASVELGYATTEYGVQGQTIARAHVVRPPGGSPQAMYVDLTRSSEYTIVYVPTRPDGEIAPGQVHSTPHRSAAAVLAETLTREPDPASQAGAAHVDAEAVYHRSARTLVERYAAQADAAAAARLADRLGDLAAAGTITPEAAAAVAADESRTQLAWLLRRVELAGHDPDQALREAAGRDFTGARSIAQVLHGRISTAYADQLTPQPAEGATDRVSQVGGEQQQALADLADLLDARRAELATDTVAQQPRWAVETLGPVPDDPEARREWEERAGRIALHREVADHTDERLPIGRCPAPGLVDQTVIWHDAWTALGRPELTRAEAEMTDGRLLTRVRAGDLVHAHAPAYHGDQLRDAATRAVDRRTDATITRARATLEPDEQQRAQLHEQATAASAEAEQADQAATVLTDADDARTAWLNHHALSLAHAEAARAELQERGINPGREPDRVTAEQWLAAEQAARTEDDAHRPITEHDLTPTEQATLTEQAAADQAASTPTAEAPTADPVAARTRAVLAELADRVSAEQRHQEQDDAEQAMREHAWRRADLAAAEQADTDDR